jgi:hypothetical protein
VITTTKNPEAPFPQYTTTIPDINEKPLTVCEFLNTPPPGSFSVGKNIIMPNSGFEFAPYLNPEEINQLYNKNPYLDQKEVMSIFSKNEQGELVVVDEMTI